jgi:hypothetical protein
MFSRSPAAAGDTTKMGGRAFMEHEERVRQVTETIPVILCIDVEPDPFLVNRAHPEPWTGYEKTVPYLRTMRTRFEEATGSAVHYTWCFRMDPQVAESYGSPTWAVDRYPEFVTEMRRHGDASGIHPHAYRWVAGEERWLEDLGNQGWIEKCVETSLDAYSKALGSRCEIFRFGNFWINTDTVNLLERRQVRYDLTVEPGLTSAYKGTLGKGHSTGSRPDFTRVPRAPYHPRRDDLCKPAACGSRSITIIPMTSGSLRLGADLWQRGGRLWRNGWRYRLQDRPLSMWQTWEAPNSFDTMLDRAISAQARPYLAFSIRSSIGIGQSAEAVDACLRALMTHRLRSRFVFSTPGEALTLLNAPEISERHSRRW